MCGQGQLRGGGDGEAPLPRQQRHARLALLLTAESCLACCPRHPRAGRKADEPLRLLWAPLACHRLRVKFQSLNIPAAKSRTQTSQKRRPVPSTWCYKSPNDFKTQVFRFQYCSGFSSLFLCNHKLFKSWDDSQFYKPGTYIICMILYMRWYTTLVLTKSGTSFVCCTCDIKRMCLHCSFLSVDVSVAKPCTCHFWKALNLWDVACRVCSAKGCLGTVSPFVSWKHFSYYCYFSRKFSIQSCQSVPVSSALVIP